MEVQPYHLTEAEWIDMKITTISLDIVKSAFHLFAVNRAVSLIKKKQLKRKEVLIFLPNWSLISLL